MRNKCCIALGFVWLSVAPWAVSQSIISENKVPVTVEITARQLMHALEKQGYEVSRGYFRLYTQDDCPDSFAVMNSCFGNNPAAPYVFFAVPPWPEEFVDPATVNMFGPTATGYSSNFRFDPREAIVILGLLPPPAAYFGLQTYQLTHEGTWSTTSEPYQFFSAFGQTMLDIFFAEVPYDTERIQVLASLSNANNNVVIERQSREAFDQVRFFIITPDQFMDEAVRNAFSGLRIQEKDIFTEPIPSTMTIGLEKEDDDFISVIRYAKPVDGGGPHTRSERWRNNLPLVVLRVRDKHSTREPETYPPVTLDSRTAWDETQLQGYLNNLVSDVAQKWNQSCAAPGCPESFVNLQRPDKADQIGPDCTNNGMNCLADTQDTTYEFSVRLALDEGEVYAAVGPLSTKTGNATYVSLGVNNTHLMEGVGEVSDQLLSGTALEFASNVNNADKFFVYYFTRDCQVLGVETLTGGHCFEITPEMIPVCADPTDPPPCARLQLSLRNYIRPGTERGPDVFKILPSVVIPVR